MVKNVVLFLSIWCLAGTSLLAQPCHQKRRPLVLIHGFLGAGDNYGPMLHRLYAGGYCPQRCFAFDWNTIARGNATDALDKLVDSILTLTGAAQVDMMGHSAGGGVAYGYLADSVRQAKVGRYIHIGSSPAKMLPGQGTPVPTLNIYSTADRVVKGNDIPGATNCRFETLDHFEVVTADSTAQVIYSFLTGKKSLPAARADKSKRPFVVRGRLLSLGENVPQAGGRIVLRALDNGNLGPVLAETTTDANGNYELNGLLPATPYALFAYPATGRAVVHFLPEVRRGEKLLYLRTLPQAGMVALLLNGLPKDSSQMALVAFSSNRAIQHGRDTLAIQGKTLSTAAFADASKTAIAWFLYDANVNRQTDMSLIGLFGAAPFMRGIDMYLGKGNGPVTMHYNGKEYLLPFVPASTAVCIAVLQ